MKLANLNQSPLNTTYMGMLRGVLDYYGIAASDSLLFGLSGHGFAINIHNELCPSGPYCWDKEPIRKMLRNLGVQMDVLGFFSAENLTEDRHRIEGILRIHLDACHPCGLMNMENQLITGYDESGFQVTQPWKSRDFPPKTLTFGSWQELGDEIHVEFYSFQRTKPAPLNESIQESLQYAVRAWRDPESQTSRPYGFGPIAYDNWIGAVKSGEGATHGNWWNGTVWSECRKHVSDFFCEVSPELSDPHLGPKLNKLYSEISNLLAAVSERERPQEDQIDKLFRAKALEEEAIERIEAA